MEFQSVSSSCWMNTWTLPTTDSACLRTDSQCLSQHYSGEDMYTDAYRKNSPKTIQTTAAAATTTMYILYIYMYWSSKLLGQLQAPSEVICGRALGVKQRSNSRSCDFCGYAAWYAWASSHVLRPSWETSTVENKGWRGIPYLGSNPQKEGVVQRCSVLFSLRGHRTMTFMVSGQHLPTEV